MKLAAEDITALDDSQRTAVLEALVAAVLADGKATSAEIDRFNATVGELPWGVDKPVLMATIAGAQQRIAAFTNAPQVHDFVAGLAARLTAPDLRDKILYTMASLIYADGEVKQDEKNVLGLFVISFGITSDRVAAIKAAVTAAMPPKPAPPSDTAN
jgi:uncharacterized tellurite resistance protein B-like protein